MIVQETDGSTIVVDGGTNDTYRVRLTSVPDASVTLTLRTDMQTLLDTTAGFDTVDESGDLGFFEYSFVFNAGNWHQWVDVEVSANPDFEVDDDTPTKSFAPQDQNLNQIQGPLIIEGGVGAGEVRALVDPVLLPGETNDVSEQIGGGGDESDDIDTLNLFHTDNNDADAGELFYRTLDGEGNVIANPGLALTGFEMGDDTPVEEGTTDDPLTVFYGGGITLNGFEIVELLLGKGDETLSISDTGDREEKDPEVAVDPATITAIHGGGGSDTIIITERGEGPLVVYGDTSEDGVRYSNGEPAASVHGTSFNNPGNDTIDASGMPAQGDSFVGVVVYGGDGIDTITGSQGGEHLAGGRGTDTIHGEAGNDHVYGDSHFNVDLGLFSEDQQNRFDTATELDRINDMFTVPTSGTGDADVINGGTGDDVILGDHGVIGQTDGTRRIESTGDLVLIETTNIGNGAGDTVHGDAGNDFIFGGTANDTVYGDRDSDLIFGDHGTVAGDVDPDAIGAIDGAGVDNPDAVFTYTSDTSDAADASAGDDTIHGGSLTTLDTDTGGNILLGQQGSDTIYGGGADDDIHGGHNVADGTDAGDAIDGGAGNDVILGDNGSIERTASATDPRFTVLEGTLIYDDDGNALVADGNLVGDNPSGVEARRIVLFDHEDDPVAVELNFGDDTIAGGADDDVIFGQLGNDEIHGDGALDGADGTIFPLRQTIEGSDVGGDDYIEGNGGDDIVFGGLGQDDIVGGSSEHYNLNSPAARPDGADVIFGGNGDMVGRNDYGDAIVDEAGDLILTEGTRHARDADTILGDNGNIYRLVGTNGVDGGTFVRFNYDNYDNLAIVARAASLLDYTPGGTDFSPDAANDIGGNDTIRGESGDDAIYGQVGNDILFGDGQDDDLIGGYGNDWISGGTGQDGALGDDGRIYTSRNTAGDPGALSEPLYGIGTVEVDAGSDTKEISTPGNMQVSEINQLGSLKKTANLSPFNLDAANQDPLFVPANANDIIYGGLGDDFLHGGAGDDAMSGAEALPEFYENAAPQQNVLGYGEIRPAEFNAYNENSPRPRVFVDESGAFVDPDDPNAREFLLNFDHEDSDVQDGTQPDGTPVFTDGNDVLFGDLGNDWLVGGTGRDHLWGGRGDDLLNADDNHDTSAANDTPDTALAYEDIAHGGAGRDILIANTGGDRLIDNTGEFNSYLVPFGPFGPPTTSRNPQPQLMDYLYELSEADGADQTLGSALADPNDPRNGEPNGEIGLVVQGDPGWQDQTGGPDDPQAGNVGGGNRDVRESAGPETGQQGAGATSDAGSTDTGTSTGNGNSNGNSGGGKNKG